MLALLIAAAYQFPTDKVVNYDLKVTFEGYVPVFGGINGKVDVTLNMAVTGLDPKETGAVRLSSDLTGAEIRLDGEKFPLTVDNLKQYFPKNTIAATTLGEIKENDAPDLKLPVRLPGLDVKRVPEISYMPVQFPADMEEGKPFTYKKPFGDSTVEYEMTPKMEGSTLRLSVKLAQSYSYLEDESHNKVDVESDAKFKVATSVSGSGTIIFDTKRGQVTQSEIVANAQDTVTDIKAESKSQRNLKTTLVCKRR